MFTVTKRDWVNIRGFPFSSMQDRGSFEDEKEVTAKLLALNDPLNTWVSEWGDEGKIIKQWMGYKWLEERGKSSESK